MICKCNACRRLPKKPFARALDSCPSVKRCEASRPRARIQSEQLACAMPGYWLIRGLLMPVHLLLRNISPMNLILSGYCRLFALRHNTIASTRIYSTVLFLHSGLYFSLSPENNRGMTYQNSHTFQDSYKSSGIG